ncbi:MAG: LPS export ABC transporter ATP-binding protein [Alphaproteobacteria bacterium]|nr:LPS export ABC transporter ATP-binding protein [Alphaproteobacteria bacterium]MBQ3116865.1 LPS export ABC transporter ATP-binding protein [Alphaproteobacteria bacterium]MBQ6855377.1 LPS export ABC transporter ATP-binding protein [Alphaproteobacteria bacterium]MBR3912683.1 LPS export ABC transporter ATP-binding protein [Alphaproteobacteria bacterium]
MIVPERGLVVSNLSKNYKKRTVLKDVSLSVQQGEAVGLLGPNGAGKTTSFYCVTGLIAPDSGKITLNGIDITKFPVYRRARLGIGYLPQEASIFRGLNVEDNIRAVLEVVEKNKDKREQDLDALLKEFSIEHLRFSPSRALSGGERRRLEIARALASKPSFILLDEPLAGIDPIAVGEIKELVGQLKNRGLGVLITDHNVRETLSIIDRAYILHDGVVLKQGVPEEIIADENVRKTYLGKNFSL